MIMTERVITPDREQPQLRHGLKGNLAPLQEGHIANKTKTLILIHCDDNKEEHELFRIHLNRTLRQNKQRYSLTIGNDNQNENAQQDNNSNALILYQYFKGEGAVEAFKSLSNTYYEQIKAGTVEIVVITDYDMPGGIEGHEVRRQVADFASKKDIKNQRIYLFTGTPRQDSYNQGFTEVFDKYAINKLLTTIITSSFKGEN